MILSRKLIGKNFCCQEDFDRTLIEIDGTENKSSIGANAILATSLAFAKACAVSRKIPLYKYIGGENAKTLPIPMMNILNGGAHAGNNIDIQEFMIRPTKPNSFKENLRICSEIYHTLGGLLKEKGLETGVGDEGGFAPNLSCDEEAIELIIEAIAKSGYNTNDMKIALDVASSEWYKDGMYIKPKSNQSYTPEELICYYRNLCDKYPIFSIEDPLAEDDWNSWSMITDAMSNQIQLVGDDLFVTNIKRLNKGIENGVANAILIKPNQIGTLTETIEAVRTAQNNGYKTIISHRSGESEDTSIADIAVGLNCGQIKSGAPCRTDRVSKYNRLLIIENEIFIDK